MISDEYNINLLAAVRQSNFSLEEIALLARISEPVLYRILTGLTDPDPATR